MTPKGWTAFSIAAGTTGLGLLWWGMRAQWDSELATGVAGLWVGVAGFVVTIAEIRRAATSSELTREAVGRTVRAVAASRLAVAITEMRQVAERIEDARSAKAARQGINAWRQLASEAQGLIRRRFGPGHEALPPLKHSLEVALETKRRFYDEPDFRQALRPCLDAIDAASDELGPLLDRLPPTIDEEDEDA